MQNELTSYHDSIGSNLEERDAFDHQYVINSLISTPDSVLTINLKYWKIVEEIYFRKEDLKQIVKNLSAETNQLIVNGCDLFKEVANRIQQKKVRLLNEALNLLERIGLLVPLNILNDIAQIKI